MHRTERNRIGSGGFVIYVVLIGWICCGGVVHGIRVTELMTGGGIGGKGTAPALVQYSNSKPRTTAVFAMGCFWRGEAVFGCLPGVMKTRVGYCGGNKVNPDYHNIGDHAECLEVDYNPSVLRYEQLLDVFWSNHDPTQSFGQGPDVGEQYRSVILTQSEEETALANLSKEREQIKLGEGPPVATTVQPLSAFYLAEAEHQKFELRRKVTLLHLLGDWTDDELVTSTTAAKLNSYAAGFCQKKEQKLIHSKERSTAVSGLQRITHFRSFLQLFLANGYSKKPSLAFLATERSKKDLEAITQQRLGYEREVQLAMAARIPNAREVEQGQSMHMHGNWTTRSNYDREGGPYPTEVGQG